MGAGGTGADGNLVLYLVCCVSRGGTRRRGKQRTEGGGNWTRTSMRIFIVVMYIYIYIAAALCAAHICTTVAPVV